MGSTSIAAEGFIGTGGAVVTTGGGMVPTAFGGRITTLREKFLKAKIED
jgi:hypothetical protein